MPNTCVYSTCRAKGKQKENNEYTLHRFPKDPELAKQWIINCGK